mgnify:CR=1 FL=1|tara:strand:+ start:4135 stop:5424 length:1290 start_codon:yes stop_codon:yes gene_type:complete
MSAKIDSSVKPEDAVTCPDCGAEFDIADRLRSHIESSIRIEMAQKYEEERENDLAIHNAEIEKQRAQINDLRKAKIDFDNLLAEQDIAIQEAKAQGAIDKAKEMSSELNILRQTKIDHDNLLAEQDIAIQEAKAQGAREAMKLANQGLEEKVSQRAKEITSEKDLEISRLELEATRKNEIIERLQQQSKSGELEGEVLELAVENQLRNLHPRDNIKEVKRGNYGADIEQSVLTNTGSVAGKILWECKKHKKWQNSWLNTIRKNALEFNADTMVIVTTTMPKGMETFGKIDDVFICKYSEVPVVSQLLNHAVLKAHRDNQRGEHMMSIHERVSEYISGPEFAMVMRVVIKAYEDFEDDLRKEEQYMKTRWKSRRIYLSEVIDSITSLAGKLEYLGAGHFEVMQEIGSQVPPALPEPVIIEDIEIEEVEEE